MFVDEMFVDDSVRIRSWDDMVAEYGAVNGDIFIEQDNVWFTKSMRCFCGLECRIKAIRETPAGKWRVTPDINTHGWSLSPAMFESTEGTIAEPDVCRLAAFLEA